MTLKSDPNERLFLRNMNFLCDAIDLKQSVEGTLKVQEKYFTTVLNEVYFIVNLYSFSLPRVPQANSYFPKVCHLPLSQEEQLPKLPSYFPLTSFFEDI